MSVARARPPRAEVLAVGSELVASATADTNSTWLADRLARAGVAIAARTAVADDEARIAALIDGACRRSDVVIVTGGLGPTQDDRTREAVAGILGVDLVSDPVCLERVRARLARVGLELTRDQARQAELPRGARWIDEPLGSAAGFTVTLHGCLLAVLPGPPAEMRTAFERGVAPVLAAMGSRAIVTRTLRLAGVPEPVVDQAVRDLYGWDGVDLTILSGAAGVVLEARTHGEDAVALAERFESEVRRRLPGDVWGTGGQTLPEVVGRKLEALGLHAGVTESCTGGLLSAALTSVAGSSAWFRGGLVLYANDLKRDIAGVEAETLDRHGAVSAEVAVELARAACTRLRADVGLGVTGIAGPGGGSADKPVGLVYLALHTGGKTRTRELRLSGEREGIRQRAVTAALDLLRRHLAGVAESR